MVNSPVHTACDAAGGIEELAALIGCTGRTIKTYRKAGEWPLARVPAVHAATGIPLSDLHPAFSPNKPAARR